MFGQLGGQQPSGEAASVHPGGHLGPDEGCLLVGTPGGEEAEPVPPEGAEGGRGELGKAGGGGRLAGADQRMQGDRLGPGAGTARVGHRLGEDAVEPATGEPLGRVLGGRRRGETEHPMADVGQLPFGV